MTPALLLQDGQYQEYVIVELPEGSVVKQPQPMPRNRIAPALSQIQVHQPSGLLLHLYYASGKISREHIVTGLSAHQYMSRIRVKPITSLFEVEF